MDDFRLTYDEMLDEILTPHKSGYFPDPFPAFSGSLFYRSFKLQEVVLNSPMHGFERHEQGRDDRLITSLTNYTKI